MLNLNINHILLDEKGYPKITGFKEVFKYQALNSNNALSNNIITPYLAPEILLRETPGFEADFYSLGMIMYELMIGKVKDKLI